MSRFIDKLNQVSQAGSQSMGFRAKPISEKREILLIASLAQANVDSLADLTAGADAGLLHIHKSSSGAEALQKVSQAVSDIPWGGWLGYSGEAEIKQLGEAGCDFVVFPADISLAMLQSNEVGKILEVEASLNDGLLRAIDELPADAVLIASKQKGEYPLTWHHLMLFQHFANLLTKPLLVPIPPRVTANELQAIWKAGVSGVVIEVGIGQPTEGLTASRQAIDKLTFAPHRKRGKLDALLPHVGGDTDTITEEEE